MVNYVMTIINLILELLWYDDIIMSIYIRINEILTFLTMMNDDHKMFEYNFSTFVVNKTMNYIM